MKIGQLCVKLAGRDANKLCVVVDVLDGNYVLIDGNTRRRKCNVLHLEPLNKVFKIKKKASHEEVIEAMNKDNLKTAEKKKKKERKEKKAKPVKKKVVKPKKEKKPKAEVKEKPKKEAKPKKSSKK